MADTSSRMLRLLSLLQTHRYWPGPELAGRVDAGSCRLRMSVDSLDWPAMVLGAVGAELEVSEPPELLDHLQRIGERFLRATGTPAPRFTSDSSA